MAARGSGNEEEEEEEEETDCHIITEEVRVTVFLSALSLYKSFIFCLHYVMCMDVLEAVKE